MQGGIDGRTISNNSSKITPDVAKLFADDWLQYRKSEILPELTREAQSTCDRINRIYFEDTAEAERLFRELVPEAGEGGWTSARQSGLITGWA